MNTQALSNRQYSLLSDAAKRGGLSLDYVLGMSQTTTGSIVQRGFLAWSEPVQRFNLTPTGLELLGMFHHTDVSRKNRKAPLSKHITLDKNKKKGVKNDVRKHKSGWTVLGRSATNRQRQAAGAR